MAGEPLISIIMNCYNGKKYLGEAIRSVLDQTYRNWEIVFWDNQSTDGSAEIARSFGDERIKYFYAPEHTTLGRARNLAAEKAQGDWLAFLDCDDLWLPSKLEEQVRIIREENGNLGLVYGKCRYLLEESGAQTGLGIRLKHEEGEDRLPEGNVFPELLRKNFVTLVSAMVRRDAYWSEGGIDPSLRQSEDYDLFLKVAKKFKARAVQDEVCCYRIHDSNLTHAQSSGNYQESISIIGRYLPMKEAKTGLKICQTYLSAIEIREGRVIPGLWRLISRGDVFLFIARSVRFVFRRCTAR